MTEHGIEKGVCWQFGPFKAYEVDCPYCEKSWCSMFLLGCLGLYFVHCFRNMESHSPPTDEDQDQETS